MAALRWAVLRDKFPFDVGDLLGYVEAPDRRAALSLAEGQFAGRVTVQRATGAAVEIAPETERPIYGTRATTRRKWFDSRKDSR